MNNNNPICCGVESTWIDYGKSCQYFYCKECKQEVKNHESKKYTKWKIEYKTVPFVSHIAAPYEDLTGYSQAWYSSYPKVEAAQIDKDAGDGEEDTDYDIEDEICKGCNLHEEYCECEPRDGIDFL